MTACLYLEICWSTRGLLTRASSHVSVRIQDSEGYMDFNFYFQTSFSPFILN